MEVRSGDKSGAAGSRIGCLGGGNGWQDWKDMRNREGEGGKEGRGEGAGGEFNRGNLLHLNFV